MGPDPIGSGDCYAVVSRHGVCAGCYRQGAARCAVRDDSERISSAGYRDVAERSGECETHIARVAVNAGYSDQRRVGRPVWTTDTSGRGGYRKILVGDDLDCEFGG